MQASVLARLMLWLIVSEACAQTRVALNNGHWLINGRPTNPGSAAEGLLMNVRMVNAVFEDRAKHPEFDPEANTARFIAHIPDYAAHGVNAFTVCLQGGMPGYEGAINSAFGPDGSLRDEYLQRVERVIARATSTVSWSSLAFITSAQIKQTKHCICHFVPFQFHDPRSLVPGQ